MNWFWYFVVYSFLGCLLEVVFALLLHGHPDRKCFLVLPLCPVYGLGACACLLLAPLAKGRPAVLYVLCAAVCSAVEYAVAIWYERGVGVLFWDYTGMFGNLCGRVCLPFSMAWGLLALLLVDWIHPMMIGVVSEIPTFVTAAASVILLTDAMISHALLRRTRDRSCLCWYGAVFGSKEHRKEV